MLVELSDFKNVSPKLGNKGRSLMELKAQGMKVPDGFIVDSDIYEETVRGAGLQDTINGYLTGLTADNIKSVSGSIQALFDSLMLPAVIRIKLRSLLKHDRKYAVRSSASKEDLKGFSFAGQYDTYLEVPAAQVEKSIILCYRSMFSENLLKYLFDNKIDLGGLKMSVVVQEMVDCELSGVCFTVDPRTGIDTRMLIEVSRGLGENLVSGRTRPEQYFYDWYLGKTVEENSENRLLTREELTSMAGTFLDIQLFYGYPCDIEFAIKGGELYILQARAITRMEYEGITDNWTTANFKDGGVSAGVCVPFMYSLYEYIWEYSLRKFVLDSNILREEEISDKLINRFYGRCYWNTTTVKRAMSKVIGYREREFDNEYGIRGDYEGDGDVTTLSPATAVRMLHIALGQRKIVKYRQKHYEDLKSELLGEYLAYREAYDEGKTEDIEEAFRRLTRDTYLKSETTYFRQIFINTVQEAIFKSGMQKYITGSDYLSMLGNLEDVSHLRPFYEIWELSRRIRADRAACDRWSARSAEELLKGNPSEDVYLQKALEIIEKYGYHSTRELDVTYPCYYEEPAVILKMIRDMTGLNDSYSPDLDRMKVDEECRRILRSIRQKTSSGKYRRLAKKIAVMKEMLWWREEYKDISTRFYYLIRVYALKYADKLVKDGILDKAQDIWFLKVTDLWDYMDGRKDGAALRELICRNRLYFEAYRNYMSDNEVGKEIRPSVIPADGQQLKGLGVGNGVVTGTARVVEDISGIDRLRSGDILITRFTDTGWTPKFAMLSGIVTEYGGVLCHAAVVSREYGIPAIVCCYGALDKIRDGQVISIDGATGVVAF